MTGAALGGQPAGEPEPLAVVDAGPARNTVLQLAGQIATLVFSAGLTLYLVRALGPGGYGVYALAVSAAGLMLFPAGLGLPLAVGRFLADYITSAHQLREIFRMGLRAQVAAAVIAGVGLFAAAGGVADAYGDPRLGWPLRWVALSLVGQALFGFLNSAGAAVRRASIGLWMTIIESAAETCVAISLVVGGAGIAGAALGKLAGYTVAAVAGVYLTLRVLRTDAGIRPEPRLVSLRTLMRYAGAMFIVDVAWSAITQLDVLLIGAMLTATAVGSFGAVLRVLTVLGYLGMAVAAGIAPRLSLRGGAPDVRSFETALRYLTIVQGATIAPMLVWSRPVVDLLLGSGYRQSAEILRVLTLYSFLGASAPLITLTVTYLGEARRRVPIMLVTLVVGIGATYGLIRAVGVVGAAIADDAILLAYVAAHMWICTTMVNLNLRRLALSVTRTLAASAAMAAVLLGGGLAFAGTLLVTREVSRGELRSVASRVRSAVLAR
jgi:O-antigen/teichoic acid export membrane protein